MIGSTYLKRPLLVLTEPRGQDGIFESIVVENLERPTIGRPRTNILENLMKSPGKGCHDPEPRTGSHLDSSHFRAITLPKRLCSLCSQHQ